MRVKGRNPEHAVFSPDGKRVFVSAEEGEAVDVIDVAKRAEVAQVPVYGIAVDASRADAGSEDARVAVDVYGFPADGAVTDEDAETDAGQEDR